MESPSEEKTLSRISSFLSSIGVEETKSKIMLFVALVIVLVAATISFLLMPPLVFPENKIITIEKGAYLDEVADQLAREGMIRSQTLFAICSRLVGGEKPITAGTYLFKEPTPACAIAIRIARGVSGAPSVRVTIPEGMTNQEIAEVLSKSLSNFNRNIFFETYYSQEGYLFPDTYFFSPGATTEDVVMKMRANFDTKLAPLAREVEASGRALCDVVTMASILEKEATTAEDRTLVSGILWKRMSIGMPLQVDATFMYLLGKKSSELTLGDLQMKSAYNTYQNKGLPYGPIGNPGIDSIRAAIHPSSSPYLYYLSDNDGVMHYAKTFDEHKANKAKYLR